jgi:RNA-dependent RNA polymerase
MSAPSGSQTYWGALDNLDDLDFSELDKSFDNTSNPTKHQERSTDLPDALQDDPLPTVSQQSSFSCDPLLEHAMICFEEPLSPTQPQSQVSINSASTSSTVTVGSESQTTASTSTTTLLAKRSTSDVSYRKNASSSDIRAGASILGKRAASDTSVQGPPSKIQRQGRLPPSLYEPVVVAYSKSVQNWIDSRCLPWGVQWEIARLVSSGKLNYSQIRMSTLDELQKLGSNSKAAPLVEQMLLQKEGNVQRKDNQLFAKEHNAKFPYDELDLEEQHLDGDRYAALGVDERYQDWFGGKVVFRAKVENLVDDPKKPPQFKIKLERAELGASSRFTRRFGSKSFMRVKIPKYLNRHPDALMDFFRRPFIISGKVFRAFLEKEKNVFFYKTNETPEMGQVPQGLHFEEFLNWHNPLEGNQKQSAAKYASRFALGLSTSAPGLLIAPENICFINDIVSPEGSDMTDGAGLINKTALRQLFNKFTDWDVWPTAIQCRIAGAKVR